MFVKLEKAGGFIGQEACAKQKAEGSPKKLVGLELHDKAIARHGYEVMKDDKVVGYITTGYRGISVEGKSLAFALVDRAVGTLEDSQESVPCHYREEEILQKIIQEIILTNYKPEDAPKRKWQIFA